MGRRNEKRRPPDPACRQQEDIEPPLPASGRPGSPWHDRQRSVFISAVVIAVATVAAFNNSFGGAFVFDDEYSISRNPTIRHLWKSLRPPGTDLTVSGRPLLNFSLAVN